MTPHAMADSPEWNGKEMGKEDYTSLPLTAQGLNFIKVLSLVTLQEEALHCTLKRGLSKVIAYLYGCTISHLFGLVC